VTGPNTATAVALLAAEGVSHGLSSTPLLKRYCDLIRAFNPVCGLVSSGDVDRLEERHIVDSLSLAPVLWRRGLAEGRLLDVGSGGGFPAIPLKLVLPGLDLTMVERSTKRLGFLRKVIGSLGLQGVRAVMGSFPGDIGEGPWDAVTARAVDKPKIILKGVEAILSGGGVFLCQFGEPDLEDSDMFHVEHIEDEWTRQGLRRGSLHIIERRSS
jgi:16S rRNA (guanine527-N7)-methyltransferase